MPKEFSMTWFDGLLKKAGISYSIICLVIGVIIYFIYLFFGKMLDIEWYTDDKLKFILMGTLIAYQFFGIQYLLDISKEVFLNLCILSNEVEESLCSEAKRRFSGSLWYYVLLVMVIFPFYSADWISSDYTLKENYTLMEQFVPNYAEDPRFWVLGFDIYHVSMGFLALFLLAYILWIIFNIAWTFRTFSLNFHSNPLTTSAFSIHMKLRSIKILILLSLFCYFICISLLILSYGLTGYIFEKITLASLLLVGLIFFFIGYESLNGIVRRQMEFEMDQINKKSQEYIQKLLAINSNGDYSQKIQETNFVSNMLDVLQKQRDSLTKAYTNIYDLASIISIISAFILPILTDIVKKNLHLLFESRDIADQGISILNSIIHNII